MGKKDRPQYNQIGKVVSIKVTKENDSQSTEFVGVLEAFTQSGDDLIFAIRGLQKYRIDYRSEDVEITTYK